MVKIAFALNPQSFVLQYTIYLAHVLIILKRPCLIKCILKIAEYHLGVWCKTEKPEC